MIAITLTALLLLTGGALISAHGDARQEEAERRQFLSMHTNNLNHCSTRHASNGLFDRAIQRREIRAQSLQALQARQTSSLGKSHKSDKPFNSTTDPKLVFSGNNSCVLNPETTEGPFYVLGESIRTNLVEDQQGVPLHLDIQLIDVATCKPIPDTFVEMWNANSTGVYSGALATVNGLAGMSDKANLNRTFLRGAQRTDADGVVQFNTLFPGHYDGRAPHIHLITHLNSTRPQTHNDTLWHASVTHVGQIFFDQALVDSVKKVAPYSTNRQNLMRNAADSILLQEAASSDPFFHYVLLGNSLPKDGVFAWFSVGVNTTFTREIMATAMRGGEGGRMVTTNPKVPGLSGIFPGGFPTAYNPGMGGPAPPRPTP
ncbi:Intradiol ring-cleavage dioxygenase [Apodospora peruviana]|uniref:Intradiol ring-cleavage dioxygenase n=1 Tax=Apodospora peruviana TaxID=516989 RepID=A0AAE0M9H4_9PEZI|nr:Intradiol ring-cleavage dioxygenase [Apodospora peruviana]